MAAIGRSPYSGQPQMGMPPLDDEFMNDYEPDPAPPVHSYYPNGYDDRSDLRVPMHGLAAAPGSPMIGSSPVPIEPEGHDDSPPGLYVDDNYGDSPVSYGGNGSLSRWNGNMSVYSGGGGGGDLRGRSPMQNRNEVMWDEQTVTLRRQAKYGFGLAVSGGRDNPHYQSGETSIVVSDVLAQGPAQNRLKINDRLLIVNGQSMENVYHKAAVDALRQAGNTVTITFKRKTVAREPTLQAANYSTLDAAPKRTPAPVSTKAYQSLPRNLTQSAPPKISSQASGRSSGDTMDMRNTLYLRKKRTEGYGMQLGWVLFVQGLSDQGIASSEGVKQGDTINKINNIPVETLSYADARKLIQASKDKLMLEISRNRDNGLGLPPQISQNNSSSFETPTSSRNQPDPMQDIFVPQPMPDDEPIVAIQSPPTMAAPPRPPLPSDSYDFDSRMPPRPPSPGADESGMGIPEEPEGDERRISFYKGSSVGLRLLGGNEVGIYVTAIQPTSPAENSGVRVADRIVEVNDSNLLGKTKEDVVMMLLGIVDEVHLVVRSSDLAYRRVRETGKGDKFFIRAHFDYRAPSKEEMSFKKGTVFRILDTMPDGNMGHWYAIRLDRTNQPAERGIIPNNNRAEQLHSTQVAEEVSITTKKAGRAAVFQRRGLRGSMMRKAKSLNKDHWDEIVFGGAPTKFPAYERVVLRESGFIRPVVIFGPIADLTRDQLLQDEPDTFETPLTERTVNNTPGEPMRVNAQGSIKIHAIRDIMDKGKHCLLDITPNAVEQLNYAQCYPIVIFLNADGRSVVKEVRGQFLEPSVNKGSRKYYQTGKKLKKHYLHTFTAMIPITSSGSWYRQIQEAVKIQQNRDIWMSETRSNEPMLDDIQLPMIGPLTLPPDYESDAESVLTVDSRGDASFFTSEAESDFDMEKSPADPDKESESYSFKSPESPVEKTKTELPESAPPDNQYSTDEEGEVDDDERSRRKKRRPKRIDDRVNHNTPKDDRNSSGRPRSRSRSRSRDRRSEVAHLDAEEDEKTISAEQREKYAQKLENSWTASARPSRKDMMKKREDMKRSASQSRVDGEGMENGHMENDQPEGMIKASVQVNVESAPPSTKVDPYKFTRSTDMPREDRVNKPKLPDKRPTNSGIQLGYNVQKRPQQMPPAPPPADSDDGFPDMPIPGMQQQQQPRHKPAAKNPGIYRPTPFADGIVPSRSNLTESAPPPASFRPYESAEPPRKEVKETTFGADDDDDDDFPPIPTGLPSGLPSGMPSGLPTGLPPANFQGNIHMNGTMPTKETTFDADLEDDEPLVAWSFPSEEVPSRLPPSPPIPEDIPHRQPPPPPVASKPEVYAKPPEPVYAKVQKEPVRDSPPNWRPESPPRNDSPPSWRPESPPHDTQPARTESPYSRVDDFPEPPPNLVSVKSSFVESAPPLAQQEDDDHDYRNALRNASKQPRGGTDPRRQSPYGWAPPKENRSQQREQWFNSGQPAKKETTFGAPSHDRINNNNNGHHSPPSVDLSDLPKSEPKPSNVSSYPYDRQSYKAYRDTRAQGKHRSKSPGRMYQESSIYAPKGWKGRSPSPFTPIPVSEEALNANEGHEIVAMARGVFDHNGGCLSSVETGVSIVIPKGAIPEGIKQEVYFKVCKDTNNLPPLDKDKGETLLSPLVMCGPHGLKWLQPVELRLPHRASKTPDGWSFNLKSSDSPTDGQQSNWRNMVIPGMEDSQCQVNANSVSVLVDHF